MNRQRAVLGLLLICTLAFCAFAAPNASALKGTTAYTCQPVLEGGPTTKGFSDEHCLKAAEGKAVKFEHKEIEVNTLTNTEGTNNKTNPETNVSTNAIIKGTVGGAAVEITCTSSVSAGSLENEEPEGQMVVKGFVAVVYGNCPPVLKAECKIKEPIIATADVLTWVDAKDEMWVEFSGSKAGEVFAEITLEDNGAKKCMAKGTYKVSGTAIATPDGPTVKFVDKEAGSTLEMAGKPATFSAIETVRMEEVDEEQEYPIALTTTDK